MKRGQKGDGVSKNIGIELTSQVVQKVLDRFGKTGGVKSLDSLRYPVSAPDVLLQFPEGEWEGERGEFDETGTCLEGFYKSHMLEDDSS